MGFKHSLIVVLALAAGAFAQQTLNYHGWGDTAAINGFRADSFKISRTFVNTNGENKLLMLAYDDTTLAGRVNDTLVAEVGYQLGQAFYSLSGAYDTTWTSCIPIDTINALSGSKRYDHDKYNAAANWTLDANDLPVRTRGVIDTLVPTGSVAWMGFTPYWSPFIRFYIKGLTGNGAVNFVKARFCFLQRAWSYVRQQ